MKKFISSVCLLACIVSSQAQDFPGVRSSNYFGVNSLFSNPANLADSRYNFNVNILSLNTAVGNDQVSYKLKNIGETFSDDKLSDQFFSASAGRTNALLSLSLHGPGFMVSAGDKLGFGLTSRARVFGTVTNFEGRLFSGTDDEDDMQNDPSFPYTFQKGKDMKIAVHMFSEIGLSAGYVIMNQQEHFLKTGLSLKYLIGIGNAYYNFSELSGTIDEQQDGRGPYLTNAQGRIAAGIGGLNIDAADAGDVVSKESRGFGADIGFVYEFRPDYSQYTMASGKQMVDKNKYKFKLGISLLDVGRIKYEKDPDESADYRVNVGPAQRVYLDDIGDGDEESLNDYFASRPDVFQPVPGNSDPVYRVNLPTTLNVDLDYLVHENFYLNLFTQLPLNKNSTEPYNNKLYTTIALTPRYEKKSFGFYLPIQYNALTKLNVGTSFRFGPVFVGSGSVLTALMGNAKLMDVHVGISFGGLKKNRAVNPVQE
jgi:hypothetical protein